MNEIYPRVPVHFPALQADNLMTESWQVGSKIVSFPELPLYVLYYCQAKNMNRGVLNLPKGKIDVLYPIK